MTTIKINIENFYLWFGNQPGREKITLGGGDAGVHYTIIFKGNKRVVDIHKTIELADGKKDYEQILEMRWFTLMRLIATFQKVNIYLLRKFWFANRINLGKLGHHNLILFPLTPNDSQAELFIDNKRKKKLRFKKEIPVGAFLEMFLYPHEVLNSKQKSFLAYSTKYGRLKQQGLIFQQESDKRTRSFYYITSKQFRSFIRANQVAIFNILNCLDFTNKRAVMTHLFKQISNEG
jgi:hypothetical protein